ncbi:MAG: sugar phosphate isomerase/epimerase [Saprospiraceae bacterium]|jgi:sugar phosphate isomerase/epimerase|nr:sugar phosphate isomerase/epimerase [Saprospiraceae bacterium]
MIRRQFIKNSALTFLGAALLNEKSLAHSLKKKERIGIQLYSIRAAMKENPLGTLQKLAAMGYTIVEHANYVNRKFYGYTPAEFKKILADLGMKMPSGHTVLNKIHWNETAKDFTDVWKYTIEDAAFMGQKFVISPYLDAALRKSYDSFMAQMDIFNKSGELCKKSGMKFGYHNHDFEFSEKFNDRTLYDIMLKGTDADLVMQQLDTGNLYNGGAKAIDIVNAYPGRFESIHVKDEILISDNPKKYESTVIGKGIAGIQDILKVLDTMKNKPELIIEQEAYQNVDPMSCMKENYDKMKAWGY